MNRENGRLVRFSESPDSWCAFSWSISHKKTATLLGVSNQRRGTVGENQQWQKGIVVDWGLFRKITQLLQHRWQKWMLILKTQFPQKLSDVTFTNLTSTVGLQLLNLWLLKAMLRCVNDDVTTIKPGHETSGNARVTWPDESSFTLFPASGRVYVWRTPRKPTTVKNGEGSVMVWADRWSHYYISWPNYCKGVLGQVG
jgi:hypothetical protein